MPCSPVTLPNPLVAAFVPVPFLRLQLPPLALFLLLTPLFLHLPCFILVTSFVFSSSSSSSSLSLSFPLPRPLPPPRPLPLLLDPAKDHRDGWCAGGVEPEAQGQGQCSQHGARSALWRGLRQDPGSYWCAACCPAGSFSHLSPVSACCFCPLPSFLAFRSCLFLLLLPVVPALCRFWCLVFVPFPHVGACCSCLFLSFWPVLSARLLS